MEAIATRPTTTHADLSQRRRVVADFHARVAEVEQELATAGDEIEASKILTADQKIDLGNLVQLVEETRVEIFNHFDVNDTGATVEQQKAIAEFARRVLRI